MPFALSYSSGGTSYHGAVPGAVLPFRLRWSRLRRFVGGRGGFGGRDRGQHALDLVQELGRLLCRCKGQVDERPAIELRGFVAPEVQNQPTLSFGNRLVGGRRHR